MKVRCCGFWYRVLFLPSAGQRLRSKIKPLAQCTSDVSANPLSTPVLRSMRTLWSIIKLFLFVELLATDGFFAATPVASHEFMWQSSVANIGLHLCTLGAFLCFEDAMHPIEDTLLVRRKFSRSCLLCRVVMCTVGDMGWPASWRGCVSCVIRSAGYSVVLP